ncbi:unnamed protein product [Caenorhabditis sp. 36 PRJEB53466]|nr:unnamed protein product [Caenorhabditis sp. 36 PRJEB53466]
MEQFLNNVENEVPGEKNDNPNVVSTSFSSEEDQDLWEFLIDYPPHLVALHGCGHVFNDFKKRYRTRRTTTELIDRFFNHLVPGIQATHFDVPTKLMLHAKYRISVDLSYLQSLREVADIRLDETGTYIVAFRMKRDVPPTHPLSNYLTLGRYTNDEDMAIWKHLIAAPPGLRWGEIWKGFREATGSPRTVNGLSHRFSKFLAPSLHRTDFDIETKLELYTKYHIKVNKSFLEKECIQNNKYVRVWLDKFGCITKYVLNDVDPANGGAWTSDELREQRIAEIVDYVASSHNWNGEQQQPRARSGQCILLRPCEQPEQDPSAKKPKLEEQQEEIDVVAVDEKVPEKKEVVTAGSQKSAGPPNHPNLVFPFVESLKEVMTEVVKSANRQLIEEMTMKKKSTVQESAKNLLKSMKAFAAATKATETERKVQKTIQNFEENKIEIDTLVSALNISLTILGCY